MYSRNAVLIVSKKNRVYVMMLTHFRHALAGITYLPYLSSIHEKANYIIIFWTVSPHSPGSCYFRGVWTTCLPPKGGAFG